ncbi:hypothetical protein DM02DRAFT_529958 [Periconia macrospinosa]|uniref:BRCT domain-containing protein n=1 Tax=Periconia macrospinosa TaxID=97972 RepID=A0A2V1DLL0_9PLEO|nr:hypothetical protein DM02DRAFT_529958 [Periconia macrospinosa]
MPISESRHSNALGQPALLVPSPRFFDAWNSSSTGHQRAENRLSGSTSWRQSRNLKLGEQYKGGLAGGKRVSDTVGAGSEHFGKDGRRANGTWEKGAKGLREGSQKSLVELWSGVESTRGVVETSRGPDPPRVSEEHTSPSGAEQESSFQSPKCPTPIFEGLCFYVNGSTAPLVSDHHLKHVISLHGGAHSISLTRRTVTHCILGKGCGGGLSASKMQKEIAKTKKKSVRFVTVDWVLSSVKANRRLPETQFSALLPPKPQTSIGGQINKADHG